MNDGGVPDSGAWLETEGGAQIMLSTPFKIGRSPRSNLPIEDPLASRHHAMLYFDPAESRWWISDLNSTNGTYLNKMRLDAPTQLSKGDRIRIGKLRWRFDMADALRRAAAVPGGTLIPSTSTAIEFLECWMLVGDVIGSTRLAQTHETHQYTRLLIEWMEAFEPAIADSGGFVNEYRGDAFFAIWDSAAVAKPKILTFLDRCQQIQQQQAISSRMVLHCGLVSVGGGGKSSGIEPISGAAVNLVFKLEREIGDFGPGIFLTADAERQLASASRFRSIGRVAVPGFNDPVPIFGLAP